MKLVLLPGLDGTGDLFKPFIEVLPDDIETLVVSYPPNLKLSYLELVKFVMEQLPNEDYILLGESFSGPVAYQIALLEPNGLKSVIFVATFLDNPSRLLLRIFNRLPASVIFALPIPDFLIKSLMLGSDANRWTIDLFKQSINKVVAGVLSFRLQEINKLHGTKTLCKTRAIYIQATDDKLVPKKCVDGFKKMFDGIVLFQVKGPHFILQTSPVACTEIVASEVHFITKQIQPTSIVCG
ncbi:MAG: hypothetical protein DRR16_05245 [Candidatus Parabeggiatoa sp. nov. 3]|nr:MAG: hypothetical protein DRR00_03810 [Gammaproteobacteria bacterium]RKZ68570.1 MAG: hypothetical protein DRQ99_03350 [Gammaproteobacteria bacterium]RKZ88341.1 MAG: hypothetical protein DRR16_05245 [Gammaproteobacteria bacterium]